MKTYKMYFLTAAVIVISLVSWWFFSTAGEFGAPGIDLRQDLRGIGPQTVLEVAFSDAGSGLREAAVTLTQDNQPRVLWKSAFPGPRTGRHAVSIPVDPQALNLHDGPATLTVTATDRSLWKNAATVNRLVNIDVIPPRIVSLTPVTHINPGGTGMALFRVSKPVPTAGIRVNDLNFPAYPITIDNKPCLIAYFAVPVAATTRGTSIKLHARDEGGNEAWQGLPHLLLKKKFRSDRMNTSESFLRQKMPEFVAQDRSLAGKSLLETFIHVNGALREENFRTIQSVCAKTVPRQLWEGTFLRMRNAAPMAQFGDHRTYIHDGKAIGESTHLGVDLASTANAPIEAANHGVVAYAGYLGIYGNMVMIDHGLGLFSLYAHLSSIDVKTGQEVKKGATLGKSGLTGLAGGDHLHFSILVGGQFVNPTEWWDPHWIRDNITRKMSISS
ncbi:MAG: M23 family metallopeptidase [Pseudomonadota bacterium]|nr:M23 family metallopeptidase [Pseudomonadota bacterium]